jgi:hypothetical protein
LIDFRCLITEAPTVSFSNLDMLNAKPAPEKACWFAIAMVKRAVSRRWFRE